MTLKSHTPATLHPPFARYAHGIEIPPCWRLLRSSGQLAVGADGQIPDSAEAQANLIFDNLRAILSEAAMAPQDVAHISGWVTDRAYMAGYMAARDRFTAGAPHVPASTLMIVSGFTRPEFKVEIEIMAAAP